jgi:tetratricopeptide (TPR) repeat protein
LLLFVLAGCGGKEGGEQVLGTLSKEIKANPEDPQGYVKRGLAYLETETYQKALGDFKHATELQGNNAYYHTLCARTLLALKMSNAALARTDRARTFNVNLQDIYWVRGQIFQAQGQEQAALASFDTAVGIDRKKPEPYVKRGEFHMRAQRFSEALKDFSKAVSLDSNNAIALDARGKLYFVMSKYDSAFVDLEKARVREPGNPHFLSDLAHAYYERQDKVSARRLYEEALKRPDRLAAREIKGIKENLAKLEQ